MNQIETKFYETLTHVLNRGFVIAYDQKLELQEIDKEKHLYFILGENPMSIVVEIHPEKSCFQGYIPDFAIYINGLASGLVIEIDDHEWHEKTKEQVRADKEKDRIYLKNRFIPVRFSGSEIYHNVERCIQDLFEIIFSINQFWKYEFLERELAETCISNEILTSQMQKSMTDLRKLQECK